MIIRNISFLIKNSKTRWSPLLSSLMETWETWGSDSCLPRQYLDKAVPWVHNCCCRSKDWKGSQVASSSASTRSRDSTRLTPGGSGPYPGRSGKLPRMEVAAPLGQPDPALSCLTVKWLFLTTNPNFSRFRLHPFSLVLLSCPGAGSGSFSTLFHRPFHPSIQTLEKEN